MMDKYHQLPDLLLEDGICILKKAAGESMLPTIPAEAVLKIEPLKGNRPKLGDVLFFTDLRGNKKIHRVALTYRRRGIEKVQTWGDNCRYPDPPVSLNKIAGKVVAYKNEDIWHRLESGMLIYSRFFLQRYCLYYLLKTFQIFTKTIFHRKPETF